MHLIGDRDRIRVGLTADVQQHRLLSVGSHDRIHRLHAGRDCRDIARRGRAYLFA